MDVEADNDFFFYVNTSVFLRAIKIANVSQSVS